MNQSSVQVIDDDHILGEHTTWKRREGYIKYHARTMTRVKCVDEIERTQMLQTFTNSRTTGLIAVWSDALYNRRVREGIWIKRTDITLHSLVYSPMVYLDNQLLYNGL